MANEARTCDGENASVGRTGKRNQFNEEPMKEAEIDPQDEREKDEIDHFDEIDRDHYLEGAGDA